MISFNGDFCLSNIIISIVIKYNNLCYLSFDLVQTLILFLVSSVICNIINTSVVELLIWL